MNKAEDNHPLRPKYRPDIDGLRAVAVLAAIMFHAFPGRFALAGGFTGVDIFFVISGYLISTILLDELRQNRFNLLEFYSRRIRRLFPALAVVLVCTCIAGWFLLLPNEFKQLGKHLAGGAGFVANFLYWKESGYFDPASETKPLLHLWSLGVEEQFYLIWPLFLWISWKQKWNLGLMTSLLGGLSLALTLVIVGVDSSFAYYSPVTRFWEILLGGLLAYFQVSQTWSPTISSPVSQILSVLGLGMILAGLILITEKFAYPGFTALIPTIGTVCVIAAGKDAWLNRHLLSNRKLVWVGIISYPLYLWHWPLLCFLRIISGDHLSDLALASALICSVILAVLTYYLIEKPMRFGKYTRPKVALLSLILLLVGCVGFYCYLQGGFIGRLPSAARFLSEDFYSPEDDYRAGTCFLSAKQDASTFEKCQTPIDPGRPMLVLWGDSHAAHLYRGYEASLGTQYNIVQRSASNCPPIMDETFADRLHCRDINDYVLQLIQRTKPNRVVLAANWPYYAWNKVGLTIARLKQLGIKNIDLIGPVPQWIGGLPRQLMLHAMQNHVEEIPYRMQSGLRRSPFDIDREMSEMAKIYDVNYLSPIHAFCNEQGCLTRTGGGAQDIVAWDFAHLTLNGSRFLVSHLLIK